MKIHLPLSAAVLLLFFSARTHAMQQYTGAKKQTLPNNQNIPLQLGGLQRIQSSNQEKQPILGSLPFQVRWVYRTIASANIQKK